MATHLPCILERLMKMSKGISGISGASTHLGSLWLWRGIRILSITHIVTLGQSHGPHEAAIKAPWAFPFSSLLVPPRKQMSTWQSQGAGRISAQEKSACGSILARAISAWRSLRALGGRGRLRLPCTIQPGATGVRLLGFGGLETSSPVLASTPLCHLQLRHGNVSASSAIALMRSIAQ